jgi:hypothetical protein
MGAITRIAVPIVSLALAVTATTFAPLAKRQLEDRELRSRDPPIERPHVGMGVFFSCGGPDCGTYLEDPNIVAPTDNRNVIAIPRSLKSQRFQSTAFYADGRHTLTVDVPDGVRCIGYNLSSHDVYSWDEVTLAGTIVSTYDAGCYGAPGGTDTYGFALQRF